MEEQFGVSRRWEQTNGRRSKQCMERSRRKSEMSWLIADWVNLKKRKELQQSQREQREATLCEEQQQEHQLVMLQEKWHEVTLGKALEEKHRRSCLGISRRRSQESSGRSVRKGSSRSQNLML